MNVKAKRRIKAKDKRNLGYKKVSIHFTYLMNFALSYSNKISFYANDDVAAN
jgi:hypothetical protein